MKPRVLQLIDSFQQGGSERQALQLTRLLCESGRFQVQLACLSPEGILRNAIADLGLGEIPSYPLSSFYDLNALTSLRRFVRLLKTSRVDILHTHDFYTNVFGMAAGKLARTPVRIASMRETDGMRTPAQKRLQRLAYSLAHQVVANSESVRDELIKQGLRLDEVAVVYNGLDLDRLKPRQGSRSDALSLLGLPSLDGRRFVTIVANLRHDVKDYPMFLRSARRVHDAVPEAVFLIAGEGELIEAMRALAAELGIGDHTIFLGRCEHVPELLRLSEICVLSSKAEGFSNAILEYMAAGRPVVATDVGGANEAMADDQTGYLVASGDDRAMAERIVSLLQQPERARRMGENGRRVVETNFTCAAQLKKTEDLYCNLLSRESASLVQSGSRNGRL